MTHRITLALFAGLAFTIGCGDKDDASGGDSDTDTDADTDTDTDTDTDADTDTDTDTDLSFTIEGSAIDLATASPAPADLCIAAVNPDAAVTGGAPVTMAEATIDASGNFSITGVNEAPVFGILLSISDCDVTGTGAAVLTTATPMTPDKYAGVTTGDTISGMTAFSVSHAYANGIDASLNAAGYAGSIWVDGGMMGAVWDSTLAPIGGATISGTSATVYYQDGDSSDGLFTTAASLNTTTVPSGGAIFLIPQAAIAQYSADADGYTFGTNLLGSNAGSIVFAPFIAAP